MIDDLCIHGAHDGVWMCLLQCPNSPNTIKYQGWRPRYMSWSKLLLYCSRMVLTQIDWCLYIHYILIYPLYSDTGHTSWTVHPSPAPLRVSPFGVRREAKTWGPTWQSQRSDGPRPTSVNKQSLVMLVLICWMPFACASIRICSMLQMYHTYRTY